ncbi:MAG: hypothetical protein H8E34_06370 [Bacteroidetes bacterium]|nr:hypothetical protein [Bacteroidota bacterium]
MKYLPIFIIVTSFVIINPLLRASILLDTIPPPPENPISISGPTQSCVGTTSIYTSDIPLGCNPVWYVDGVLQSSTTGTLEITWSTSGNFIVMLEFECGIGNASYLVVIVSELPEVDLGDDITIYEGNSVELDAGNPGCKYMWSIGDTTQTIVVMQSGTYEVTVSNICGAVLDDVVVEVIVATEELSKENIHIKIDGNYIRFGFSGVTIKQLQIFDIAGRIIAQYGKETQYYLPEKGIFFIRIATSNNRIVRYKVVK